MSSRPAESVQAPVFAIFLGDAIVLLAGLLLLLAVAIIARRALRRRGERHNAGLIAPVRPRLLEVVTAEERSPESLDWLAALDSRTWKALEPSVVSMLAKVRGESRQALAELLARRGAGTRAGRRACRPGAVGRARAAEMLAAVGTPKAIADLTWLLGDRNTEVRQVATRALGRIGDPLAAPALIAGLAAKRPLLSRLVAHSLLRIGLPAVPALVAALEHPDAGTRTVAAETLGLIGATGAVGALAGVLRTDPSGEARIAAARSLGRIGSRAGLDPLLGALAPGEPSALRCVVARALGELGAAQAAPALRSVLDDSTYWVAHNAAVALGALGRRGHAVLAEVAAAGGQGANHATESLALLALAAPAPPPLPVAVPVPPAVPPSFPVPVPEPASLQLQAG